MDEEVIANEIIKYNKVIIYNPYATREGFANAVESRLMELGYKGQVIVKTVPTVTVSQASIDEQREEFHLQINDILELL